MGAGSVEHRFATATRCAASGARTPAPRRRLADHAGISYAPCNNNIKTGRTIVTRPISRRRVLTSAAGVSAAAILPRSSHADWRPTETVRIIVPAAPGGSTDV